MKKYAAFTLIELLVVIAIISLLVSILLPSLNTARELAKGVTCKSQLHGMAVGMGLYANDYDDSFVWTTTTRNTYWMNNLRPYIGVECIDTNPRPVPLFICPSDVTGGGVGTLGGFTGTMKWHWYLRSYTYNQQTHKNVSGCDIPKKYSDATNAGSFAIMGDHAWWEREYQSTWFNPDAITSEQENVSLEKFADWHVNSGVNMIFADTHVDSMPRESIQLGCSNIHYLYITNQVP